MTTESGLRSGFSWINTSLSLNRVTFLCRVPVRPEGPGEGHGDPPAAAGRFSGRLR